MGVKDIAEKELLNCADVAADALNVLLLGGERLICGDMLVPAFTETIYGGEMERFRNQLEDVAKYELREGEIQALYLISNQTAIDYKMPLRKAGYVGGAYRMQYKNPRRRNYPVVHMVLYWGKKHWKAQKNFRSYFVGSSMPEKMWNYVDDWKMYVIEMRHLSPDIRQKFTSDLRIVAEYLTNPEGIADLRHPVEHPKELLELLYTLSKDSGYLELQKLLESIGQLERNEKGERWNMCELLDKYRVGPYWDKVRQLNAELEQEKKKLIREQTKNRKKKKELEKERTIGLRALVTTCRQLGASVETTMEALQRNFMLDDESAKQQIKLYW